MAHSMTAFARKSLQEQWGTLTCEIRCVNHRYLELSIHLPDQLRSIESAAREKFKQYLTRGKIDCYLRYQANPLATQQLNINHALVEQLVAAYQQISVLIPQASAPNPMDILSWPAVVINQEADENPLKIATLQLLDATLTELLPIREREGKSLCQLILERLITFEEHVQAIQKLLPQTLSEYRKKLLSRLQDIALNYDSNRLEQEMVIFAQRVDISEELDRLNTHLNETKRLLKQTGVIGRTLDFLMQELNRETNTLGAKCNDATICQFTVKMKVLIDQMREQIQNLE